MCRSVLRRISWQQVSIFIMLLKGSLLVAQPEPCGPNPDMTPTCIAACVICDIDGFQGNNDSNTTGQEPPGFCTNTAHHMQWIAFIAGSTNLTLTVTPSNCDNGDGLEVGIYQSLNCNTFQLVSNCDGDIQEGQVGVFSNTIPLVIGQYYYFVMDGNMDDVCDYTVHVTSGTTLVPPLPAIGPIQGPDTLCQMTIESYAIPAVTGATFYKWTLDGAPAGNGITANISFPGPGQYELCAHAYNVCDTSAPSCQIITVLPNVTIQDSIGMCEGDCLFLTDTTICDPGLYTLHYMSITGCDSIVQLTVTVQSSIAIDLDATICATDSILVGGTWYSMPGNYVITVPAASGCDSVIQLNLQTTVCEFDGQLTVAPAICAGESSGVFTLELLSGVPPFTFSWQQAGSGLAGSGDVSALNTPVTIPGLPAGLYTFDIKDGFGNDLILTGIVTAPPALTLSFEALDYNGFNISCPGALDGQVMAVMQGGTPGYQYLWNNNDTIAQLMTIGSGLYSLTVTDAAGCMTTGVITLNAPAPLAYDVIFTDPGCDGSNTGMINIVSTQGGTAPYQYAISGGQPGTSSIFDSLSEGVYTISVTDANGCSIDTIGSLTESVIPVTEAGDDIDIDLGYSAILSGIVSPLDAMIEWIPASNLSCVFCLAPVAMPVSTTVYLLQATTSDGCVTTDSLTVRVHKSENAVYVPNAFSPNGDGINDIFTVFGNRSVKQIEKLSVFSRWGELVFEKSGFMANDPVTGWDGTFRGKPFTPGVFTWMAEIRFLDDQVIRYSGDLTLIR